MSQVSEQTHGATLLIDAEGLSWLYSLNHKADPHKEIFLQQHEIQELEVYPR